MIVDILNAAGGGYSQSGNDRLRSTFAPSWKATRRWTLNPGTGTRPTASFGTRRSASATGISAARQGDGAQVLVAATGISLKQTERLVRQWRETGAVRDRAQRQFEVFEDALFERLATISNGHVYNLRGSE